MMEKAKVFFTKEITPETMIKMYKALGVELPGKVAVKVHSGEVGNQNFIRPSFMKPMVDHVKGTIVECNAAYEGKRNTTDAHWETMKLHGWTDIAPVDIMDEEGEMELPVPEGKRIQVNYVGAHLANYDSMLVLSHFKGHPMGGFGGALKEYLHRDRIFPRQGIHSWLGQNRKRYWTGDHDSFLESMADADKSIVKHFGDKIAFINVMRNMSVDCDCCGKGGGSLHEGYRHLGFFRSSGAGSSVH